MTINTRPNIKSKMLDVNKPLLHALWGALFGLFFPLFAWFIDFFHYEYVFELASVKTMHSQAPLHFVIDLAPIVIGAVTYFLSKYNDRKISALYLKLSDKSESIKKNVDLARLIGSQEFEHSASLVEQNDELGQSLLLMHQNLDQNSRKEYEQNWIARGKEEVSAILRKYPEINDLTYNTLVKLTAFTNTIQASFYLYDESNQLIENVSTYAYNRRKYPEQKIRIGEGLIGQSAYEMASIYRREIPEDYITITSGILGHRKPSSLIIIPLISNDKLQGIIELASLEDEISSLVRKFLDELSGIIAQTIFNLKANQRTTELLNASRKMTIELQKREEILKKNAEDMIRAKEDLELSNKNLETQIQAVERGQKRLYSLLENASEVISIFDESGVVKYESPSARSILGYNPDKLIGTNAFQQERSILSSISYDEFKQLQSSPNEYQTFEFSYKKTTGEQLWLEAAGRNLIDNPAIAGIIFNTRDITVRKIAEQAQRMSGEMQALSENSIDIILRLSLDGTFYYANPTITRYTGVNKEDIIKSKLDVVELPEGITQQLQDNMQQILEVSEKINAEFEFESINGKRTMRINAIPEFNEEKLETVLFVLHDITDQKRIENEIKDKNKAISDSINYAQRIQSAIIPDTKIMQDYFPESFIFYRAKDVVSGDFPWMFVKNEDTIYIAAVDCTGHGVPGALLSFIGYFLLNNIVDHDVDYSASQVLDILHAGVRRTLRQDKEGANARDGMDIALLKIEKNKKIIQFSGAHRPLYYLRDEKITEYKGNKKSIGGIPTRKKEEKDFQNYTIEYEKGDRLFIFSDGLPDQVGGVKNRKYQAVRMRESIIATQNNTMGQVSRYFTKDFNDWKGSNKQIDDVLLIGIEL